MNSGVSLQLIREQKPNLCLAFLDGNGPPPAELPGRSSCRKANDLTVLDMGWSLTSPRFSVIYIY